MSNPAGWATAAVIAGGLIVGTLIQAACKGRPQQASFEFSALCRLATSTNYNEIRFNEHSKGKIFLGALPNQISRDGEKLVHNEKVAAVLSLNEPWERNSQGPSVPYSLQDWQDLGIRGYFAIDTEDHEPLSVDDLNNAADFIHNQIEKGNNVYVHCRAGKGRSAMAVAAYLIKYEGMSVTEAKELIKRDRPCSSIKDEKKQPALLKFAHQGQS